jgi:chemotaxis protein CheZ
MLVDRDIDTHTATETTDEASSVDAELSELTKYMEVITSTIRDMEAPVTTTSDQLPQATAHLNDLANMTEEGTHRVMTLTEEIETNRAAMKKAVEQLGQKLKGDYATDVDALLTLINTDERRIMDIHVALSFQDLVAQRVAKLVTILNEVQHKLLKLVVMFGIKQKKDGGPVQDGGRGYEMLRQLESSKTTALEQELVDDIMAEFGSS